MDNDKKKSSIYNNNISDLDKKAVAMKLSSCTCSTQQDCNHVAVKLELFSNIPLISNTNDLTYYKKAIYGVESFFAEHNLSIIQRVNSSSAKRNP